MYQQTPISSAVSARGSANVAVPGSTTLPPINVDLARRLRENPVGTLVRILSMPLDRTAFLWWMLILTLFAAGAGVHIWMSIQIAQAETQLAQLETEHAEIELVNAELMWQISEYTSLTQVQRRAEGLGFDLNFNNRYMPLASNLNPVVMTTEPVVEALPTATSGPVAAPQPGGQETREMDSGGQLTFERLGISVPRGAWMQDLRNRSGTIFADVNLGLDLLWQDLRSYGEQTWKRMAGEFFSAGTSVATNQ